MATWKHCSTSLSGPQQADRRAPHAKRALRRATLLSPLALLLTAVAAPAIAQPHPTHHAGQTESVRVATARRMGDDLQHAAKSAPILVKMLRDHSAAVRSQAAASLARLGEGAFPAMIAALATDRLVDDGLDEEGSDKHLSSYLSWAFANSVADPGPTLIAWEKRRRRNQEKEGLDPASFVSTTLGNRGDNALPYATVLLASDDPADRDLGVEMTASMGKGAAPLAPAIANLVSAGLDRSWRAVAVLGDMGEEGQAELARLFEKADLAELRPEILSAMTAGPRSLAAELRVAQWSDPVAKEIAIRGLLAQPEIPAAATPVLLAAARIDGTRSEALRGLSRALLNPDEQSQVVSLAETELKRALQSPVSYDVDNLTESAMRALASAGATGREALRIQLAAPATHARACRSGSSIPWHLDNGGAPSPEWQATAEAMVLEVCADLPSPYRVAAVAAAGVAAPVAPSPELGPDALLDKIIGEQGDSNRSELCSDAVASNSALPALAAARLQNKPWSDLSGIGYDCHELFAGPLTVALVDRIRTHQSQFIRWADASEDSVQELLNAMSPGEAQRPADWTKQLGELAKSRSNAVRLWALKEIGDAPADAAVTPILVSALRDPDDEIAQAAADAILQQQSEGPAWEKAAEIATIAGIEQDVESYVDKVD